MKVAVLQKLENLSDNFDGLPFGVKLVEEIVDLPEISRHATCRLRKLFLIIIRAFEQTNSEETALKVFRSI